MGNRSIKSTIGIRAKPRPDQFHILEKRESALFTLEESTDVAFDLRPGKGANEPVNEFPLFKEKQRWDALGGVPRCGHMVLIYIEFCDLNPTCILRSELIQDWGHHAAGSAPGSPAVDHYRVRARENYVGERTIRYKHGTIKEVPRAERGAALGAYRLILQSVPGYTILRTAIGTWKYNAILIHPLPPLLFMHVPLYL